MKITNIRKINLESAVPVYDIIEARPYNNFLINTGDSCIVSHNCGLM